MRFALLALGASVALLAVGSGMLALSIGNYLASPQYLNSASGLVVFNVDGRLVQYGPFVPGLAIWVLGAGIVALVASLVLAATAWKRRRARVY